MNLTRIIKREILITSLTVIGIAITFLGLTYAIYFTIDEKNIGTVSFGQLSFDMCMDESCSSGGTTYGTTITGDVYPMNTTEGTSQTPYLFKVTNNATDVMYTKVYAAKEGASSDYTNVKLAAKVQGTSTYSYADLTQDASVLIDLQVPAGQTKIIEVYMWLDEEASNEVIGKTITAFINAMGYIKPDDPNNLHTGDKHVANVNTAILQGQTFSYTGSYQEFEAPVSGYYFIETWGAQGGIGYYLTSPTPGKGAYSSGYLYLSKGEKIYIYVGGKGGDATSATSIATAGYNGGGAGNKSSDGDDASGAGGGATDIRYFGNTPPTASDLEWNSTLGLNSRIMVAAGGGGSHSSHPTEVVSYRDGMDGGTLAVNGILSTWTSTWVPIVNQTSGNAFGIGATGLNVAHAGSGGGGGYYGGVNNSNVTYSGRASGGSSFISGYAGSNAITSASDRTHTNNTLHYSGKHFLDGTMKSGIREGNGQAKIKYVGLVPRTNTKLNGVRYIKDCVNENSRNTGKHWVEIQAIKDGTNIAKNKTVTGTAAADMAYSNAVDGQIDNITGSSGFGYTNVSGNQCITVDLSSTYNLDEISVWHYYPDNRSYYENIVSVSSNNSTWTELINEAVSESSNGKRASAYSDKINGYIQDGLLVWYDGIVNTGADRSTSTTTWKNLVSDSYDGAITNGTWGNSYLTLGTASRVNTGIALATAILPTNNATFEIVMSVNSWPNTNTQYGNTGVVFGAAHYGGLGINWLRSTTNSTGTIFGSKRVSDNLMYTGHTTPSGVFAYSFVEKYSSNKLISYYKGAEQFTAIDTISGSAYNVQNSETTIGINNAGTYGGNAISSTRLDMNAYGARLYNRALTEEEIYHNYLVDKERFNLD